MGNRLAGVGILLCICFAAPAAYASMIIGSFDASRGGLESLTDSFSESGLQTAIATAFPGATFTGTSTLTSAYLSTVSAVVIGVGQGELTAIQPLSASEQNALKQFVLQGGTAILFADNDSFYVTDPAGNHAPDANNSLLSPFGLHITGTLANSETALFTPSGTVLSSGPGGTAAQLDTLYPGWLDGLGSSTVLADFASGGQAAAAYFAPGALGVGSGAAVFFADSSMMVDGYRTANDTAAILNALALTGQSEVAVPEPGTMMFLGAGLAAIAALRRSRAATRRTPLPGCPPPLRPSD